MVIMNHEFGHNGQSDGYGDGDDDAVGDGDNGDGEPVPYEQSDRQALSQRSSRSLGSDSDNHRDHNGDDDHSRDHWSW